MSEDVLTKHEQALMDDFAKRAKGMSKINLGAGVLGVVAAFGLFWEAWQPILMATLGGALIGVSLKKRDLGEMKIIMIKLWEAHKGGTSE